MSTDLRQMRGLGEKALRQLAQMGISSVEALAERNCEADFQGLTFFGRNGGWQQLILRARGQLLPKYLSAKQIEVREKEVRLHSPSLLAARILITNVLELPESRVELRKEGEMLVVGAKKVGSTANDEHCEKLFHQALGKLPLKLKNFAQAGELREELGNLDSEQAVQELFYIREREKLFDAYLQELVENRLEETIAYGKKFSLAQLIAYLQQISANLYFDSFLSLIQQYSLCDAPITFEGSRKMSTGYNLALFGQPGTGKTFATVDLVLGNPDEGIPAHGLPGMNRYCGGMTVAQFVRIGQAYEGKKFNFVVTEFNDWFKYAGMVENLKQALERKQLKYETVHKTVGPYKFDSFFSVNYNTQVYQQGYEVTINDPNFNAIEDRMITRLHRMNKARFKNILDSLSAHLLSETSYGAQQLRDHLTLIYAIQTRHPAVSELFEAKDVTLPPEAVRKLTEAAKIFVDEIEGEQVMFSPRLVKRAIQLTSAMSLTGYFSRGVLAPDNEMLRYAIQFLCEEAAVRCQEKVDAEKAFRKIERQLLSSE